MAGYTDKQTTVWVGNRGYYNEGQLRDIKVELPMADAELYALLSQAGLYDPMHEEVYVSDHEGDLLGLDDSVLFDSYTSLDDINTVAKLLEAADADELEALRSAIDAGALRPQSAEEVCALILRAGEIERVELPDIGAGASPEERYGWMLMEERAAPATLGELEEMGLGACFDYEQFAQDWGEPGWCSPISEDALRACFDYEAYGRENLDTVYLADDCYIEACGLPSPAPLSFKEMVAASREWDAEHGAAVPETGALSGPAPKVAEAPAAAPSADRSRAVAGGEARAAERDRSAKR